MKATTSSRTAWQVDEARVLDAGAIGTKNHWQTIQAPGEWQTMKTTIQKDDFTVATDL
jgi:hypothetical protein